MYKELRKSLQDDFQEIFEQAVNMAADMNIEPAKPHTAGRQKNRANAPSDSIQEYYLRNMAFPFLDHIVSELQGQFSMSVGALKLLGLVPSVLGSENVKVDISEAVVQLYKADLPSIELVDQEVRRWKFKWQGQSANVPETCAQGIKKCDELDFPCIFQLLKIVCSLPVT